jgi:hypothetical protein
MKKKVIFSFAILFIGVAGGFWVLEGGLRIYYQNKYNIPRYKDNPPCPIVKAFDETKFWDDVVQEKIRILAKQYRNRGLKKKSDDQQENLDSFGEDPYLEYDPYLGWDNLPGQYTQNKNSYSINSQRIRAEKEYPLIPELGIKRAIFVGDSFTFCYDTELEDCWISRLDQKLGVKAEILNMGVAGYGSDQAFLKWRRHGLKFNAPVAVLCIFMNDIFRNVNMFRIFFAKNKRFPISKPRFIIDEKGELKTINFPVVPLEELKQVVTNFSDSPLREYEYFYDRFFIDNGLWSNFYLFRFISKRIKYRIRTYEYAMKPGAEPYEITIAISDTFRKTAIENNVDPYIIIIPTEENLASYNEENYWGQDFLKELDRRKINHLDLTPELYSEMKLRNLKVGDIYAGHFTKLGNEIAAEIVHQFFVQKKTFQIKPVIGFAAKNN